MSNTDHFLTKSGAPLHITADEQIVADMSGMAGGPTLANIEVLHPDGRRTLFAVNVGMRNQRAYCEVVTDKPGSTQFADGSPTTTRRRVFGTKRLD